jgi:hypothetical protein
MDWRIGIIASVLLAWATGCQKEPPAAVPPTPIPAAAAPNANAAHYGSHGVSAVPAATAPAGAPSGGAEPAEHPCACGATCHCGHCSGAVPGCHCQAEKAQQK